MGRSTNIYAFDAVKARDNLYDDLTSENRYATTFKEYVVQVNAMDGCNYHYDKIIETVAVDTRLLSSDDFSLITGWLGDISFAMSRGGVAFDSEAMLYNRNGIYNLFFYLCSSTAYGFMFQLGNFSHYYPSGQGQLQCENIFTRKYFLHFMDYMLLLTAEILYANLDDSYVFTESEIRILDSKRKEYSHDVMFNDIIQNEFAYLKKCFSDRDPDAFKTSPEEQMVYSSDLFFQYSIEAINILQNTDMHVIISDSY